MRVGLSQRIGKGTSVHVGKNINPGGCVKWLLYFIFLPFILIYLYIKWCIRNNNANSTEPIYKRAWIWTTTALLVLGILVGIFSQMSENVAQSIPQSQSPTATTSEIVSVFEPREGYDVVQSLFLNLEENESYTEFLENVKGSGLEYLDRPVSGGKLIEVWETREKEYTNKLEVLFYNVGDDNEYIRTAEYWYTDSSVRISLHNNLESYEDGRKVLCIIDSNEKEGSNFKTIDFSTITEAMNHMISK
ncbi:hypothetical protein [Ruthenibacterium lactatiformans]|uniref:hypothetical protein n=1 Tax=Ruthenibacterium lactatiformans TaxID=1550024 RepID=UPI003FD84752